MDRRAMRMGEFSWVAFLSLATLVHNKSAFHGKIHFRGLPPFNGQDCNRRLATGGCFDFSR